MAITHNLIADTVWYCCKDENGVGGSTYFSQGAEFLLMPWKK